MYDQQILRELQGSWPETTDYLVRVGQVTNDLMVLRELAAAENASPTWLTELAVDEEDLLQTPTAVSVLRFLHGRGIEVKSTQQVLEYQELRDEQEQAFEEGTESTPEILEDLRFSVPMAIDAKLWELPELQKKLMAWAAETATKHGHPTSPPSLTQAIVLMQTVRFMEQEPEQSPDWAAELLRSALSSEFYERAASPQQ
ncbi:hypothetical protein D3248_01735 [Leucobacter zeae]|nr:hypothetical protein [Leucobacter zeae]